VDSDFIPWVAKEGEPALAEGYNYKTLFHSGLNKYINFYQAGGVTYGSYIDTEYYVPNLI
jgi:hypothetical protein